MEPKPDFSKRYPSLLPTQNAVEIECEADIFCHDMKMMVIRTNQLFNHNHPEPDGYRYGGGGKWVSTSS